MTARARSHKSLAGRTVAITGGARGIGAATAAALSELGANVAVGDLDADAAQEVARRLGGSAIGLPLDVTDRAGFTAFLDEVESRVGPLDILVNNAGIMPLGRIDQESDETTERVLAVNLHAVIHGTREAIVRMKPRHDGHVVNVASAAGKIPVTAAATYTASKHGVVGFCEAVRRELPGTGIELTCVLPGMVATELAAGVDGASPFKAVTPDDVAQAIVGALQRPRFEVFVPGAIGPSIRVGALAGRRFGDVLQRLLKTDAAMFEAAGSSVRRDYEARIAQRPADGDIDGQDAR